MKLATYLRSQLGPQAKSIALQRAALAAFAWRS